MCQQRDGEAAPPHRGRGGIQVCDLSRHHYRASEKRKLSKKVIARLPRPKGMLLRQQSHILRCWMWCLSQGRPVLSRPFPKAQAEHSQKHIRWCQKLPVNPSGHSRQTLQRRTKQPPFNLEPRTNCPFFSGLVLFLDTYSGLYLSKPYLFFCFSWVE
jgi:hypothetical protein